MLNLIRKHWPTIMISLLLGFLVLQNFRYGKLIIGNDNFSPELNPTITLERSLLNPAWRSYRVLGIPSDSEQGDLWRTLIFWISEKVMPAWVVSQLYLFFTLAIGVVSMGQVARIILPHHPRLSQFFGSLLYLCSLLTIWVYFYPVHLFVAAYAFTPFVIWRLLESLKNPSRKNHLLLFLSSLLTGTTALTATMWITTTISILIIAISAIVKDKIKFKSYSKSVSIYFLPHLFWILPFVTYVISNNQALQNSYINREITATTIQSENSANNSLDTLRFASTWLDTKEDDLNYTYPYRDWFKSNKYGVSLGFLPAALAIIGFLAAMVKPKKNINSLLIGILGFFGWLLLNGGNPPLGSIYTFFDSNIPLFHQVFRWGSSKFWPLLFLPIVLLAVHGIGILFNYFKFIKLHILLALAISFFLTMSTFPIITDFLVRKEMYVVVPKTYENMSDKIAVDNRMDTTPHTNTRYFRRYDWGFWGSVVLNYVLPNPTTEKALIIGSDENEAAFNVLDESYNSGSPTIYANALKKYDISTILSDKSVTHEELGSSYSHPYDWELHKNVVENNPQFTPIFSEGKISLYQTSRELPREIIPIQSSHNAELLNKLLSAINGSDYVSFSGEGSLFPLALKADKITHSSNSLNITSKISTKNPTEYILKISKSQLTDMPLVAYQANDSLTIVPYFPTLLVNGSELYELPTTNIPTPVDAVFTSLGTQIITQDKPITIESTNMSEVTYWDKVTSIDLLPSLAKDSLVPCSEGEKTEGTSAYDANLHILTIKGDRRTCIQIEQPISQNTAASLTISASSDKPTYLDICVHSILQNKCINKSKVLYINKSLQTNTLPLDYVVAKDDSLAIFILRKSYLNQETTLNITNLSFSVAANSTTQKIALTPYTEISASAKFSNNDVLTTSLPLANQIPTLQPFFVQCETRGTDNKFEREELGNFNLVDSNCFDGLYSSFSLPSSHNYSALLTYVKGKHIQGIPLELNLKQNKNPAKIMTDLMYSKPENELLKFTLLPLDDQNFTFEVINKGIGKNPSINTLSNFQAIPVPKSWLDLRLVPSDVPQISVTEIPPSTDKDTGTFIGSATNSNIYTIPQSTSPYWKLVRLDKKTNILGQYSAAIIRKAAGTPTTVNGWQQAWYLKNDSNSGYYSVVFLPNILAYLGLIFGVGTSLLLALTRGRTLPSVAKHVDGLAIETGVTHTAVPPTSQEVVSQQVAEQET